MNTPAATKSQAPGVSPTGESVPRTGQGQAVANLAHIFNTEAEEAGLSGGGRKKRKSMKKKQTKKRKSMKKKKTMKRKSMKRKSMKKRR